MLRIKFQSSGSLELNSSSQRSGGARVTGPHVSTILACFVVAGVSGVAFRMAEQSAQSGHW
jgi:hypothetical protein